MKDPNDSRTQEISPLAVPKREPGRPRNPEGAKTVSERVRAYRVRQRRAGKIGFSADLAEVPKLDLMRTATGETQGEFVDRLVCEEWERFQRKGKRK